MGRRRALVLALLAAVIGIVLLGGPASAAREGRWDRITTQEQSSVSQIGLLRTQDGVLHVAWQREAGPTGNLFHTAVRASGELGATTPIVTGWAGMGDAALVPEAGGGIRLFFNGTRTTITGEPLFGLNTATAPPDGSSWSLAPASIFTGDFAYARTPAAALAPDGTPFQAWYSVGQTVVHRGLSPDTPTFPYGSDAPNSFRQNLAADSSSGRMFVAWCSFGREPTGVFVQEVNTASGAPAGGSQKLPGSTTAFQGADHSTCNLERTPSRMPLVARVGGGLYVAGAAGYPSLTRVLVWRLSPAGSLVQTIPVASSGQNHTAIAIAAAPDGTLVVGWAESGPGPAVVHLRRSDETGAVFGSPVAVRPPAGAVDLPNLDLAAQTDRVDVVGRFGTATGTVDLWHTQASPPKPLPPVIAPTPPAAPGRRPARAPRRFGVVARAFMTLLDGSKPVTRVPRAPGLRAHFLLRTPPAAGASLKVSWYYNNRLVGEVLQPRAGTIRSFAKSIGGLPKGYFRGVLMARFGTGAWRPVADARARVG